MFLNVKLALAVLSSLCISSTMQHAYLSEPPSRASAWLTDPDFAECCLNYDYNQMFCGGARNQWEKNGGKCGICGDPYDQSEPRTYEKGGEKYLGKIVRNYAKATSIPVTVQITANHMGYFEFRVCNVDGWETDATQACLNETVLKIQETNGESKYRVNKDVFVVNYNLVLPTELVCNHCVLQWKYVTGNSWGFDEERNESCVGCGPVQEHFLGCADISIFDPEHPDMVYSTTSTTIASTTTSEFSTSSSSSSTSSDSEPSTSQTTTRSSSSSSTSTIESETSNTTSSDENYGCKPKLEFGTKINISRVVSIYCNRMCKLRCEKIIQEFERSRRELDPSDKDLVACLETCPVLCDC